MAVPGTMVNNILDRIFQYFKEPKNRERIQTQCIDPIFSYILDRMFPYIILTCVIFSLILLMSLTSIGLIIFKLQGPSALIESTINTAPV
jgi:ABC-type multidrug transport system permease subunit